VLPFQNLSAEGTNAYFAGGLHEEVLTQLAKVAALKVISRTSVMPYDSTTKPLKTIARELGVGSVVEGSVQVVGDRLRVNVQLIDAATDEHLWAEHYDRTLDDAFAIQSDVAQQIANAVGATLSSVERGRLAAAPTANAEAYRLYLQGFEYYRRPAALQNDYESAEHLFEHALALDPNFALAHAALSLVHGAMNFLHYDHTEARAARQRVEAEVALRLAPDLSLAHFAMGRYYYQARLEYPHALNEFKLALEGLPSDAEIWQATGTVHRRLGHWNEAMAAYEKAAQLNPRDANLHVVGTGNAYRLQHRYANAVGEYEQALSLAPDLLEASILRGWIYADWQGQLDTLRVALSRAPITTEMAFSNVAINRAQFYLWERDPVGLLQTPGIAGGYDFRRGFYDFSSGLYVAWAYQLRGDHAAERAAFDSACVRLQTALTRDPDEWDLHAAFGLALAGRERRAEALREARWLQESAVSREDHFDGPRLAESRARILAQAGEPGAALDEIERLLAEPSWLSVNALRLDPIWDPIREQPRFKALVKKYSS
jgi:serine/threonine-protein kinase